jgi:hypothetical protein
MIQVGVRKVHLASFLEVLAAMNGEQVEFSAFDDRLSAAAASARAR